MFSKLRTMALSALAVSLVFGACENTDQLTAPSLSPKAGTERVVVSETGAHRYKMVQETDPKVGTVTAVIDQNGGSLSIGGTTLSIPAGAVKGPTTFTMDKPNGELTYEFSASRGKKKRDNDVGAAGFRVPLTLTISYAGVSGGMREPTVVYINPQGHAQALETSIDAAAQTMSASIQHFSVYGGADTLTGCDPTIDPTCPS